MSEAITFYTNPMSRGRMVRWMLEECQATYEVRGLHFGPQMKDPSYIALNPMGKVPTLVQGQTVITETAAICAYLADKFADKQLAPEVTSPERGNYYRWLFFGAGPVEAAFDAKALGLLVPSEGGGRSGYGTFESTLSALEGAVKYALSRGGYLCGSFTAADLYLASHLYMGVLFKTIEPSALFDQYVQPLISRPACVKAAGLDDALSKQMGQSKAFDQPINT